MVEFDYDHSDRIGNLGLVESSKTLHFGVNRVYSHYDVLGGGNLNAHTHKKLNQLIIAVSGLFTITRISLSVMFVFYFWD